MRFIWPLQGHIITRDFAFRDPLYVGGQHAALDLIRATGQTRGSPILAVADGVMVAYPGLDYYSGYNAYVDHADGWRSGYRHFIQQVQPAGVPIQVKQGQIIAFADSTGSSTGDHLHFDLWNKNKLDDTAFFKVGWYAHDPELYLGVESEEEMTATYSHKGNIYTFEACILQYLSPDAYNLYISLGQIDPSKTKPVDDATFAKMEEVDRAYTIPSNTGGKVTGTFTGVIV